MEEKIKECSKCHKLLPWDCFRWKNKALNKKHSQCKECQKVQEHEHYLNSQERRQNVQNRAKTQKNNNVEFIENIKKQGCEKCGDKRTYVLDFHHINPQEKDNTIAHMIKSSSLKKLAIEVDKCKLLCANCHREFHYLEKENKNFTLEDYLKS